MKCQKCGQEFTKKYSNYSNGNFCSIKCAKSRQWSEENKKKMSQVLKLSQRIKSLQEKNTKEYVCEICGKTYKGFNRYHKCKECRKKVMHYQKNPESLLELSKRTMTKVLQRANMIKCSICGWDEASCDLHHILERKKGGSDKHENLIIVCPNCHRKLHTNKDNFKTKKELYSLSLMNTFKNWKEFYYISN